MLLQWGFFIIGAYLLGSIPFGKLIAIKVARIDITRQGSGNIGATNVARTLGVKWGLLTLLLDILKGFIPVAVFSCFASQMDVVSKFCLPAVGLAVLLGHQFPFFQLCRGGKGVATALGIFLGISSLTRISCIIAFLLFILTVYKWNFVSLGSMVSATAMPLLLLLFGEAWPVIACTLIAAGLILFKHRGNIQRLLKGKERKWSNQNNQGSNSSSLSNSSSE